ncbi:MAG: hypothetical protein ACI4EI_02010 [Muricoprocola sp.]
MKKFILGISIFWYGALGTLITYVYTLLHQSTLNGHEGWLINFVANDTGIPLMFFIILMVSGSVICVKDITKHDQSKDM